MNKAIKYLLVTGLITFLTWGVLIITQMGTDNGLYSLLLFLGAFSPAIAGIITTEDRKKLFKSIKDYRHNKYLYLFIFILPLSLFIVGNVFFENDEMFLVPFYLFPLLLIAAVIGGGLEEIGWRGVLQKELEKKFNIITYTIIIGLIWTIWHLPLWFIKDSAQADMSFLFFFGNIMLTNLMYVVIYNKTRSVFMLVLFHSVVNAFSMMFTTPPEEVIIGFQLVIYGSIYLGFLKGRSNNERNWTKN